MQHLDNASVRRIMELLPARNALRLRAVSKRMKNVSSTAGPRGTGNSLTPARFGAAYGAVKKETAAYRAMFAKHLEAALATSRLLADGVYQGPMYRPGLPGSSAQWYHIRRAGNGARRERPSRNNGTFNVGVARFVASANQFRASALAHLPMVEVGAAKVRTAVSVVPAPAGIGPFFIDVAVLAPADAWHQPEDSVHLTILVSLVGGRAKQDLYGMVSLEVDGLTGRIVSVEDANDPSTSTHFPFLEGYRQAQQQFVTKLRRRATK